MAAPQLARTSKAVTSPLAAVCCYAICVSFHGGFRLLHVLAYLLEKQESKKEGSEGGVRF